MSTLKEELEGILEEKKEKIIPENIKEGVTIFGVEGTYTGDIGNFEVVDANNYVKFNSDIDVRECKAYQLKNLTLLYFLVSGKFSVGENTIGTTKNILMNSFGAGRIMEAGVKSDGVIILFTQSVNQDGIIRVHSTLTGNTVECTIMFLNSENIDIQDSDQN